MNFQEQRFLYMNILPPFLLLLWTVLFFNKSRKRKACSKFFFYVSGGSKIVSLAGKSVGFAFAARLCSSACETFCSRVYRHYFLFHRFKWCYREHVGLCNWEFLSQPIPSSKQWHCPLCKFKQQWERTDSS